MKKTSLALLAISALMITGCSSRTAENVAKTAVPQAQQGEVDPSKLLPPDQAAQAIVNQISGGSSAIVQQMPAEDLSALVQAEESGDIKKCDALKSDGDQKTCKQVIESKQKSSQASK